MLKQINELSLLWDHPRCLRFILSLLRLLLGVAPLPLLLRDILPPQGINLLDLISEGLHRLATVDCVLMLRGFEGLVCLFVLGLVASRCFEVGECTDW